MENFLCALTGGILALLGVFIQGVLHENHQREVHKKEEAGLLASIRCEFTVLLELFNSRQDEIKLGKVGENGYLELLFPINGNYLSYFDSNYQHFHKITDQDLRLEIQLVIAHSRSHIDSVLTHNNLINEYQKACEELVLDETNKNKKFRHKICLDSLVEYDKDLILHANSLYSALTDVIQHLDMKK